MDVDGAAGITHAAQGMNDAVLFNGFYFHYFISGANSESP
jgi:hypothetical protein